MRNQFPTFVVLVLSGVVVAAFTYFFLNERGEPASVVVDYNVVRYGKEVSDALRSSREQLVEEVLGMPSIEGELPQDIISVLVGEPFLDEEFFSDFGFVEEILVRNKEREIAAEVLIEGRGSGLVAFSPISSLGPNILEDPEIFVGDFSTKLRILPDESIVIRHFSEARSLLYSHQIGSDHIKVSQGGKYLSPSRPETALEEVIGIRVLDRPLLLFLLLVGGVMFWLLIIASAFASVFPKLQWLMIKMTSEKELAFSRLSWRKMLKDDPAKAERVERKTTALAAELGIELRDVLEKD